MIAILKHGTTPEQTQHLVDQMENRDYALFCGDYFVCLHTFLLFPGVNNVPIRLFCRHKILYLSNRQSLR